MPWSDVTTQVAGYLVLADDWNDIINNLKHLRGQDGTTVLEGDVDPETDLSQAIGSASKRWNEGHFNELYASNGKKRLHEYVRSLRLDWLNNDRTDIDIEPIGNTNLINGDWDHAGQGQMVLWCTNDDVDAAWLAPIAEQGSSKDVSWKVANSPYGKWEFSHGLNDPDNFVWIGFRQTVATPTGGAIPSAAAENYAGLHWDGTNWYCEVADGSSEAQSVVGSPAAGERHVLEILIINGGAVLFWINGSLVWTSTGNEPTGDLDWTMLMGTVETDEGVTFYTTIGPCLFQEDLS